MTETTDKPNNPHDDQDQPRRDRHWGISIPAWATKRVWAVVAAAFAVVAIAILAMFASAMYATPGSSSSHQYGEGEVGISWIRASYAYAAGFFVLGAFFVQLKRPGEGHPIWDWAVRLLHEVGMALLVGCVVAITFELSLHQYQEAEQRRRQAAIEKDAIKYLLGYGIEKDVMDEVHQSVFSTKLVRQDQKVKYEFACAKKPGHVRLTTEVRYWLKNLSSEPQYYKLEHYFHSIHDSSEEPDQYTNLVVTFPTTSDRMPIVLGVDELRKIQNEISLPSHSDSEGGAKQKANHDPSVSAGEPRKVVVSLFNKAGTIQHHIGLKDPLLIPPGDRVLVHYAYIQTKRNADMVTYYTTHPTTSFSVTAMLSDANVHNLKLEADSAHRLEPKADHLQGPNPHNYEWHLEKAVLPGQGIEIYWYPDGSTEQPKAVAAEAGKIESKKAPQNSSAK
jgi:hypothetical protein